MPHGEDPLERAARKARGQGLCPAWQLDAFCTNHWGFVELCAEFARPERVAADEDMGFPEPWAPTTESLEEDIPF